VKFCTEFGHRRNRATSVLRRGSSAPHNRGMAADGVSRWSLYRRPIGWAALAALGQIASLSLIDAGNRLHYQHYLPFDRMLSERPVGSGIVAVQAILVVIAIFRGAGARARGVVSLGRARLLLGLALASLTAATVSPDPRIYVAELGFAALVQCLNLFTLVLAAVSLPDRAIRWAGVVGSRMLGSAEKGGQHDRFAWGLAIAAAVVAAGLSLWSYERHPHIPDEVTYVIHAKYLAAGMLTMPAPPVPEAFDIDLFLYDADRWYSSVPPGWPAVLAIGSRLGLPWLVNPLLTALAVLLAYAFLLEIYERRTARVATLLLTVSPWFLLLGMSYMTHMLSLVCVLLAGLGVARSRRTGSALWGLVAGLGVGVNSVIRPLDGLIIGGLVALWSIGIGGRRLRAVALAWLFVGTVGAGSLGLAYNWAVTGNPRSFPVVTFFDQAFGKGSNDLGFGANRGTGWGLDPNPGHSPLDGLINANLNAFSLNIDLFGWSSGSLVLVALAIVSFKLQRADWLMIAMIVATIVAYFFYWYSGGPDFGARYWYPIIVPLVVLSARGLELSDERGTIAVGLAVALALTIYLPWRAVDKYWHFRGMQGGAAKLVADAGVRRALVLVRGERFPDYASAAVLNPPDLRSDETIYAWDRDSDVRARLFAAYPDRPVWVLEGPSVTGSVFRLSDGPVDRRGLGADEGRTP
jgi:4-amino-4-deoxy-L-arabinose transferase-like glycosyltransferase